MFLFLKGRKEATVMGRRNEVAISKSTVSPPSPDLLMSSTRTKTKQALVPLSPHVTH